MNHRDSNIDFEPFESVLWAPSVHIHTILPSFSKPPAVPTKRIEIETPDDDFLEIDLLHTQTEKPIVALFHGLEGSSERPYIRNLMYHLRQEGYSSVALNFRGCGSRMNNQPRMYHSGETSDYATFFKWISKTFPNNEIYAVGFSLGANALVKSLGEEGAQHWVSKAVTVSPPYSLKDGSVAMNTGFNKIYQKRFIRTLAAKTQLKKKQFPDFPIFTGSTMYDFDDQVTAPLHGFKNADDYYAKSSSGQFYEYVKKPLLIIHSKEDTICPLEFAPHCVLKSNPHIETLFTEKGGHVGFLSSKPHWLNRSIIKWLKA
ncbi:MAG: alpha/beta fold hydrolase [Balneolaceae bacterium]